MRYQSLRKVSGLLLRTVLLLLVAGLARPALAEESELAPKLRKALCKVYVTRQGWNRTEPWKKYNPGTGWVFGVMVRSGLVLAPASAFPDHVMIEVSVANSARHYAASLAHLDYGANLALVKIDDFDLATMMEPLPLGDPITTDDEFEIWQLGTSDLLERFTGHVQKVEPSSQRLRLTIKTTLSDRGGGQPVLKDGKLVGIVTQTRSTRQEGYVTAVETIRHYLEDYDSGDYEGFGSGPFWYHQLLRDDFRDYYQVPEDVHGIVVSRVLPGRTGYGALKAGDVLAEISGHALDDEGMFQHPLHGRLQFFYLIYGSTHPGEEIPVKVYREGKALDLKMPIRGWPIEEQRVPEQFRDQRRKYMVVCGMVIMELTNGDRGSWTINQYQRRRTWDPPTERKRIVFVNDVLDDIANKGMTDVANDPLLVVNGKKITCIEDVAEALKAPVDGYHVFEFEGINKNFVIKAADLPEIDQRIAKRYRVTELTYLGGEEEEGEKK